MLLTIRERFYISIILIIIGSVLLIVRVSLTDPSDSVKNGLLIGGIVCIALPILYWIITFIYAYNRGTKSGEYYGITTGK